MSAYDRWLARGAGALSLALGSLYVLQVFGPTEAEVGDWGLWSLAAGLLALLAGSFPAVGTGVRVAGAVGFGLLALAQLPPVLLWIHFHGSPISDGTPPSWFTAHWAMALPHALLLLGAAAALIGFGFGHSEKEATD